MVKKRGRKKRKFTKKWKLNENSEKLKIFVKIGRKFILFLQIRGICNMHYWFGEWMPLNVSQSSFLYLLISSTST